MTRTEPFLITFRFETPPILRGACTLDAVLGGEIARHVEIREEAIARTPLACTDRVHHGSSLLLLADTGATRPVSVVRKPRAALIGADPAVLKDDGRRLTEGSAKNALKAYEACVCEGGAWLGVGRIDEIGGLLGSVLGIGKRRGSGWGMIEPGSLEIEPVHADPARWGLVSGPDDPVFATECIVPCRPLPVALFARLGGDPMDAALAVVRVRQPYYDPACAPEPAVVPQS